MCIIEIILDNRLNWGIYVKTPKFKAIRASSLIHGLSGKRPWIFEKTIIDDGRHVYSFYREEEAANIEESKESKKVQEQRLRILLMLGIAYSSSIGGLGVITGSGTNMLFRETLTRWDSLSFIRNSY